MAEEIFDAKQWAADLKAANKFDFDTPNEAFTTEGRSSIKLKLNAKGVVTAEVKVYKDDTFADVEKAYQLACEFIERIKARHQQ